MSIIYTHQENKKESPFLWLRFIPNNKLEVLTDILPKTVDLRRIDAIIKQLYPTVKRENRNKTAK